MKMKPTTFYTFFCSPCGSVQHTEGKDDHIDYMPMFHSELLAQMNMPEVIDPEHPMTVARVALRLLPTTEEAARMSQRMMDVFIAQAGIPMDEVAGIIKQVVEFNMLHGTNLIITNKPPQV